MKKLIIIPAYNEQESIKKTVEDIMEKAPHFDYIVINDCSTDKTKEICETEEFNVIHLPVNLGIGGAVQTGYLYAARNGYDIAVQVDGDGQHDPQFLSKMADYMEAEHADMVIGSRFIDKEGFQSSEARRVGIKYFTMLIKLLTGTKITDPTSGLRMVNREIIEFFARRKKKVLEIPVIMRERSGGVSSISMKKSVYYMIKVSLAILIERIRK